MLYLTCDQEKYRTFISTFFNNPTYTPMAQLLLSVFWGILLSPFSRGIAYLLISIVVGEILMYVFCNGKYPWIPQIRAAVVCGSFFGFILGRSIGCEHSKVMDINLPDPKTINDLKSFIFKNNK